MAARCGEPSDYRRAAAHILAHNPLGGVCGSVCPDTLCMARCSRRGVDAPVDIPAIQGAIVREARRLGVLPRFEPAPATGQRVAVVGAGPAGFGAASVLAKAGHTVHLFDRARRPGGMVRLVPRRRLDPEVLEGDLGWLLGLGDLRLVLGRPVALPRDLLARGFAAVIVTAGLSEPVELDVPGHERALGWPQVLGTRPPSLRGRRVGIVGDGAVALDCAEVALSQGAAHVELLALKALSELGLGRPEHARLLSAGLQVTCRVRVSAIRGRGARVTRLELRKVELPPGVPFHPSRLVDLPRGEHERHDLDTVILAVGSRPGLRREPHPRVVYAGDLDSGPSTVVEALASGKKAGLAVHNLLAGSDARCPDRTSCADGSGCPKRATCPEWVQPSGADPAAGAARASPGLPVALTTELLGRPLASPFLLAAGPYTAGYAQLKRAYAAGWAGGVTTAPSDDVERLRRELPDRLTLTSLELPSAGDPMDWRGAAELLARGAPAVLVGTLVTRHGLGVLSELQGGLSHFLAERGLRSVSELVGSSDPTTGRSVSAVDPAPCTGCGNCSRCPQLAITLDARGIPAVDPARCTGCGGCVDQCLAGAITLRPLA
jgi:NADPH-dependent glutamate synthase beta subunit-like oxidoreductase/Pyruvate/2-oxoacid:ferredoxin oxidoreductase delta subunit